MNYTAGKESKHKYFAASRLSAASGPAPDSLLLDSVVRVDGGH